MSTRLGLSASQGISVALYLGTVGLVFLLLVLAYAYLLAHERRDQLYRAVDVWLTRRVPQRWGSIKAQLLRARGRTLGLAAIATAFGLASYFFAEVTEGWLDKDELFEIDQRVYETLAKTSNPFLEGLLGRITYLGSFYVALTISCVLLAVFIYQRAKQHVFALFLIMGVGEAVAWALKLVFARKRPVNSLINAAGDAFPSGHAFTAVALYGFIIYLIWDWTDHPALRVSLTALLGATAVLVGVSRIFLRAHWFSDVLGGFTLGLGWLVCSLLFVRLVSSSGTKAE